MIDAFDRKVMFYYNYYTIEHSTGSTAGKFHFFAVSSTIVSRTAQSIQLWVIEWRIYPRVKRTRDPSDTWTPGAPNGTLIFPSGFFRDLMLWATAPVEYSAQISCPIKIPIFLIHVPIEFSFRKSHLGTFCSLGSIDIRLPHGVSYRPIFYDFFFF